MNNITPTVYSIVYKVADLNAAKAIQTSLLDTPPHTDTPFYVGFNVGGFEIALTPRGEADVTTAPIAYVLVADLEQALADVCAAGAVLAGAPQDVGGGTRTATVTDPDGNTLGLMARGQAS